MSPTRRSEDGSEGRSDGRMVRPNVGRRGRSSTAGGLDRGDMDSALESGGELLGKDHDEVPVGPWLPKARVSRRSLDAAAFLEARDPSRAPTLVG